MQAESSINLDWPAEDVFAFLARPSNHARFVPGVSDLRLTSSTMAEGAEAVGTRRVFGIVRRLPYRITVFQLNRVLAMTTAIGLLEGGDVLPRRDGWFGDARPATSRVTQFPASVAWSRSEG